MSKILETKPIGKFEVVSGNLRISDPCYELDASAGTLKAVKKGEWDSHVVVFDEGSWGKRIGYLIACHCDHRYYLDDNEWKEQAFRVGVDSGQAGIFDEKHYRDDSVFDDYTDANRQDKGEKICEDEPWYSWCCDRTCSKEQGGVIPYGCVSSSGVGDGCYTCSTITKDGKVVAVLINFGLDEDEDEIFCDNCGREIDEEGLCRRCDREKEEEENKK